MRQLIVNADDLGLTPGVNEGILDSHREGIVTSASLMANGSAFDTAVSISRRAPELGIGVHLNLTTGDPVSTALKIRSLVDGNGRLHFSVSRLLQALVLRRVDLGHVESELRAQITKVVNAGILPTHVDGHKHVHLLPGVSDIVIRLAQEFSIRSVRCPLEVAPDLPALLRGRNSRSAVIKQYLVGRTVSGFAWTFKKKLVKAGLLSPGHFYGLSQTGFLHTRSVRGILGTLPEGVSELMCHPGYLDEDLERARTRLLGQREVEIRALTAPIVKTIVADCGIHLINYRGLKMDAVEPAAVARHGSIGSASSIRELLELGGLYDE
jgi:hopanoid biosynthesis associated protein HpnK